MEVILESRLNNHSLNELNTFGETILFKIREIRSSKDQLLSCVIDGIFDNLEIDYPENFFMGVYIYPHQNGYNYYRHKRKVKGKEYCFHTLRAKTMYDYSIWFSKKHNVPLYKDNRKNNFKGY